MIPVGVRGLFFVMSVCVYFLSSVSSHRDPAQSSSSSLPACRYHQHHHHHHHYITQHHPLSPSYVAGYIHFIISLSQSFFCVLKFDQLSFFLSLSHVLFLKVNMKWHLPPFLLSHCDVKQTSTRKNARKDLFFFQQ